LGRISLVSNAPFVGKRAYYDGAMTSVVLRDNTLTYNHYASNQEVVCAKEPYQEALLLNQNMVSSTATQKFSKGISKIYYRIGPFFENLVYWLFMFIIFKGIFVIPLIIVLLVLLSRLKTAA